MEISRYSESGDFASLVGKHLQIMHACMKTFGKPYSEFLVMGFLLVLSNVGATPSEFKNVCGEYLMDPSEEFPSPGDFASRLVRSRDHRATKEQLLATAQAAIDERSEDVRRYCIERFETELPEREVVSAHLHRTFAGAPILPGGAQITCAALT